MELFIQNILGDILLIVILPIFLKPHPKVEHTHWSEPFEDDGRRTDQEDKAWNEKLASAADADFDDSDWQRYEHGVLA